MDEKTIVKVLDACYDKALTGLPGRESVMEQAAKYLQKYSEPMKAAKKMCDVQAAKCGTSGFVTGLGGIITLPVAIPANIASVIYVQLQMVAAVAAIGGYDPSDDEVRTMAYVCLTGQASADVLKQAGIAIGRKLTVSAIKKIPGSALTKINQKVGFRLLTKFGEKGVLNLGKMVPVAGGAISGVTDVLVTKVIAKTAVDAFIS